jgi:hypothetical protein
VLVAAAMRRLLLLAGLWALAAPLAQAGGVIMVSGPTAAEGRIEAGLPFPDGGHVDANALAAATRELGARDDSTILWYPDAGAAQRLETLSPDQRVVFSCLSPGSGIYERGGRALTRSAPPGLDPVAWVRAASGRIVWWPTVPESVDCGTPVALLDVAPASLAFGDVLLGASAQADAVLTNIGRIDLELQTLAVEGTGFTLLQHPCNGQRLSPGESCTLRVGFAPTVSGAVAGRVLLPNTGMQANAQLPIAGRGLAPALLQVDPTAIAFGDVIVGATSPRTLTVSNGGDAALALGTMNISGAGFSIIANTCDGANLAAAQSCAIDVQFAPVSATAHSGTLQVVRADAGAAVNVALTGQGITPALLTVDPTAVAFGNVTVGATQPRTLTVSNGGQAALALGTMSISGNGFSITANTCNDAILAAAQACAIELRFAPASATAHSGTLQIARADAGAAVDVALIGQGVTPAQLTFDPSTVAFGDVIIGESLRRTVTVGNSGQADLSLGTIDVAGSAFTIASDACSGNTLAAATECEVSIDFLPLTAGAANGTLTIPHGSGADATVALQGTGTEAPPAGPMIFRSGFEQLPDSR